MFNSFVILIARLSCFLLFWSLVETLLLTLLLGTYMFLVSPAEPLLNTGL